MQTKESTFKRVTRVLLGLIVIGVVGGLAYLGWQWHASVEVSQVDVTGVERAPSDTLQALARVDVGTALFDVDPAFVADRVQRHPWVETASVTRLPTGTVRISVTEREPIVLVKDADGSLSRYLDAAGFPMPVLEEETFNVPILGGLEADFHPIKAVDIQPVPELLKAIKDNRAADLISEFHLEDGEIAAYATSPEVDQLIPVYLGNRDFGKRLHQLEAFWERAVLSQPEKEFEQIDLRFEGQIITREQMQASVN